MDLPLQKFFFRPYPTAILSARDYGAHIDHVLKEDKAVVRSSVWSIDFKATINHPKNGIYTIIAEVTDATEALGQPTNLKTVAYPGTDIEVQMLAQEYAKATLKAEFDRFLPHHHQSFGTRNNDELMKWQPPIYFGEAIRNENVIYIDLTSAYANFYERLSLDMVDQCNGRFGLAEIRQKLEFWKMSRNSLIGIIASCKMKQRKGEGESLLHIGGKWFAPQLWANIQMLLHEIANEAIKHGALYIGTDCYIFRIGSNAHKFHDYLNNFDIKHKIYYGECTIYDWQTYEMPVCFDYRNNESVLFKPRNLQRITRWNDPKYKFSKLYREIQLATNPVNNLRPTPPCIDWWSKLQPCKFRKPYAKPYQPTLPTF